MRTFFILACVAQKQTLENRPLDNQHGRLHAGGNTNKSFFAALHSGFWIGILDSVVAQRHFCHQNQATGSTELWVQPTS